MRSIGVGVIGCGRIATRAHLPVLQKIDEAKTVAVVDAIEKRARNAAEEFRVPKYYTDVSEALEDPEIDAVHILLPHHLHAEVAIKAMKANKHVLIEKPMCLTSREAEEMVSTKNRTGVKLMVAMMMRFESHYIKAKELIEDGKIGKPILLSDFVLSKRPKQVPSWWRKRDLCGGFVLGAWLPHLIDRIHWLANSITESVYAEFNYGLPEFEGETDVAITMRLGNQALAQITLANSSSLLSYPQLSFRANTMVIGSDSSLVITTERFLGSKQDRHKVFLGTNEIMSTMIDSLRSYEIEIREFIDAIEKDREPSVTVEDGRDVVRTLEAIQSSASTRRMQYV